MYTAEEQAEYQTYVETRSQKAATTYSIPLAQRMWIERQWRPLGYTSKSHLVQVAINRLIESSEAQAE